MTGWRARIGVLFPGNAIVDDELCGSSSRTA
jgi:hypothetical protein